MPISPSLIENIRVQSESCVQPVQQTAPSSRETIFSQYQAIVDTIPGRIATVSAGGGTYVDVMTLCEHRDFSRGTWKERVFSKAPLPGNLKGIAVIIFAWCEENGLQPFLAPYVANVRTESRIIIHWDNSNLQSLISLNQCFLTELERVTAEAQAQEAAIQERERLRKVQLTIAQLHRKIADNSVRGLTSAEVGEISFYGKQVVDLRTRYSWARDVIAYCEKLGLTVKITKIKDEKLDIEFRGRHCITKLKDETTDTDYSWRYFIYVEWKAQTPVL